MQLLLQAVLIGAAAGAGIGGGLGFVYAKRKEGEGGAKQEKTTTVARPASSRRTMSSEAKDILNSLDVFQKWPEFQQFAEIMAQLEKMEATKPAERESLHTASRLVARANRLLDYIESHNRTVTPLNLAEDVAIGRKFLADIKFNIYQSAS